MRIILKTLFDETEDMQIKAAIQASLQDIENENKHDTESDHSPPPQFNTISEENWKNYLGSDNSPKVEIVIRYPDGNRENTIFPSTSKMKVNMFFYEF